MRLITSAHPHRALNQVCKMNSKRSPRLPHSRPSAEFNRVYHYLLHSSEIIYIPLIINAVITLLTRQYPHITPAPSSDELPSTNPHHWSQMQPGSSYGERRLINFFGLNQGSMRSYHESFLPLLAIVRRSTPLLALVKIIRSTECHTVQSFNNAVNNCVIVSPFLQNSTTTLTSHRKDLPNFNQFLSTPPPSHQKHNLLPFFEILVDIISNPDDSLSNMLGGSAPFSAQLIKLISSTLDSSSVTTPILITDMNNTQQQSAVLEFQCSIITQLLRDAITSCSISFIQLLCDPTSSNWNDLSTHILSSPSSFDQKKNKKKNNNNEMVPIPCPPVITPHSFSSHINFKVIIQNYIQSTCNHINKIGTPSHHHSGLFSLITLAVVRYELIETILSRVISLLESLFDKATSTPISANENRDDNKDITPTQTIMNEAITAPQSILKDCGIFTLQSLLNDWYIFTLLFTLLFHPSQPIISNSYHPIITMQFRSMIYSLLQQLERKCQIDLSCFQPLYQCLVGDDKMPINHLNGTLLPRPAPSTTFETIRRFVCYHQLTSAEQILSQLGLTLNDLCQLVSPQRSNQENPPHTVIFTPQPIIPPIIILIASCLSSSSLSITALNETLTWLLSSISPHRSSSISPAAYTPLDSSYHDPPDDEFEQSFCWNPFFIVAINQAIDNDTKILLLDTLFQFFAQFFTPSSSAHHGITHLHNFLSLSTIFDIIQSLWVQFHNEPNQFITPSSLILLITHLFTLSHRAMELSQTYHVQDIDVGDNTDNKRTDCHPNISFVQSLLDQSDIPTPTTTINTTTLTLSQPQSPQLNSIISFYTLIMRYVPILFDTTIVYRSNNRSIEQSCELFVELVWSIFLSPTNHLQTFIFTPNVIYSWSEIIMPVLTTSQFTNLLLPSIHIGALGLFQRLENEYDYFHKDNITTEKVYDLYFLYYYSVSVLTPMVTFEFLDGDNNNDDGTIDQLFGSILSHQGTNDTILKQTASLYDDRLCNPLHTASFDDCSRSHPHHQDLLAYLLMTIPSDLTQQYFTSLTSLKHGLITHNYCLINISLSYLRFNMVKNDQGITVTPSNFVDMVSYLSTLPFTINPDSTNSPNIIKLLMTFYHQHGTQLSIDHLYEAIYSCCNVLSPHHQSQLSLSNHYLSSTHPLIRSTSFTTTHLDSLIYFHNNLSISQEEFITSQDVNNNLDVNVHGDLHTNLQAHWGCLGQFGLPLNHFYNSNATSPLQSISSYNNTHHISHLLTLFLHHTIQSFPPTIDPIFHERIKTIITLIFNSQSFESPWVLSSTPTKFSYDWCLNLFDIILSHYTTIATSSNHNEITLIDLITHLFTAITKYQHHHVTNHIFIRYLFRLIFDRHAIKPTILSTKTIMRDIIISFGLSPLHFPPPKKCTMKRSTLAKTPTKSARGSKGITTSRPSRQMTDLDVIIYSQLMDDFETFGF